MDREAVERLFFELMEKYNQEELFILGAEHLHHINELDEQ
ncbi:unnamed protein product [Gongylonema pulchrum]|uniref:ARF-like 2-binding protein n=1 Tax=Gongylonema pulchrum TaxID=637853 RepID=A0A183D2U5_9BILA|nr:unnamed protein product [Gongylonema pulchrum]